MDGPAPVDLAAAAHRIREHIVRMCGGPEGGHLGGSMSLVEILTVLYFEVMRVDPLRPAAPERDILLLSKGHGAVCLYSVLAERGFFPVAELAEYARPGSRLMGHPVRAVPGVEMPTGSLGHGLALANGFALADRGRRCFAVLGDGELQEGAVWEAAMASAALGLANLTVVVDRNGLQITGPTEDAIGLEPLADRWRSFGWTVREAAGHDFDALRTALARDGAAGPVAVIAHTVKGRGLPSLEAKTRSHYAKLSGRQAERSLAVLRARRKRAAS
ncbi:transketolase [Actinomadura darangshiensis]|uniref:Transketolase n=1 Tax=Actinomadura darangshiensis TaxID=705336 RepID=A0A4R5BHM2_9ACTN|nr:transketolase [Actinomadura darangshiensis]TDD84526.1 transketolase [Actinomadura darangshiensis]